MVDNFLNRLPIVANTRQRDAGPSTVTFTPRNNPVSGEPDGYDFEGPTRFDKLFTGIAVERPKALDRTTEAARRASLRTKRLMAIDPTAA